MFDKHSAYHVSKVRLGLSFLLRQGQGFLLEIHNHSRHTFSQYFKEGKPCQNGSNFVIPLDTIQARLCLPQDAVFMLSGTVQPSPMKCCTTIVPL